MCKIIHTDFKPENVVICLRDDEVKEIAHTGQLTTTKMFNGKAEIIKKLNMKIAGTLPIQKSNVGDKKELTEEEQNLNSWNVNMDGLTSKQKKNLRKKLQRKRRKNLDNNGENDESKDEEPEQVEESKQAQPVHVAKKPEE